MRTALGVHLLRRRDTLRRVLTRFLGPALILSLLAACGSVREREMDAGRGGDPDAAPGLDGAVPLDADEILDASAPLDADEILDASAPLDGAPEDGASPTDAGRGGDGGLGACSGDHAECDDGLFCTGRERCEIFAPGRFRCTYGTRPCEPDLCDEEADRCCPDADGDGALDAACGGTDCDDRNAAIHPGAWEICDPEAVDEDCDPSTLGTDEDLDGHALPGCCNVLAGGGLACGDDCDDTSPIRWVGAPELCNLGDDDCDGAIDEGRDEAGVALYLDCDRDGAGDPTSPIACQLEGPPPQCPSGFTSWEPSDCDDTTADVSPFAAELCNGRDDDCDGAIDRSVRDADGDGAIAFDCGAPYDCQDWNAAVRPGLAEICDGEDNDCDPATPAGDDLDHDGHIVAGGACAGGPWASRPRDDCDDTQGSVSPGTPYEVCDGRDGDCDGAVDEGATAVCHVVGATSVECIDGVCVPLACGAPRASCDGRTCSADLSNVHTCGACDRSCEAAACESGECNAFAELGLGDGVACARTEAGSVWCWGARYGFVFGPSQRTRSGATAISTGRGPCVVWSDGAVEYPGGFEQIVPGAVQAEDRLHTCVRRLDGTIVCWGDGTSGQLGDGRAESSATPVEVAGIDDAIDVTVGWRFSCAVRASGRAQCWGHGALGTGDSSGRTVPTDVIGVSDARAIAAGDRHACAVTESGRVVCWGNNFMGQCGPSAEAELLRAAVVEGVEDAVDITAGEATTCALTRSGEVWCWGDDDGGAVGDGGGGERARVAPTRIATGARAVAAGKRFGYLLRATGGACWGVNFDGQLGDGTTNWSASPTPLDWQP